MNRRRLIAQMPLALATGAIATVAAASEGHAAEERRTGGGETFVLVPTTAGTVMNNGGRRGVLSLQSGIDVPDSALKERATASVPRLRAAFAQVIQTYAANLSAGALPDADYLARELQRQTDLILGRPGARFLLGSIIVT